MLRCARSRSFLAVCLSLAILFALLAKTYQARYSVSAPAAIAIYVAFVLLLVMSLAPAWKCAPQTGPRHLRLVLFLALWLLPYLIYAAGTHDFRWPALLKLLALAVSTVFVYTRFPPRRADVFSWQDAVVAVLLIGFVMTGQMKGIWNVPVNLDFLNRLFLITIASWCWTFVRVVPERILFSDLSGSS